MRIKFFALLAVFGLASSAMIVTAARPAEERLPEGHIYGHSENETD